MKVLISNTAFDDFESIKQYYLEQGVPAIGQDFVVSIIEHIHTLADHPSIGRMVPEFGKEHIREIIHAPFRVVYLKETNAVQVIRIWRSERLLILPDEQK